MVNQTEVISFARDDAQRLEADVVMHMGSIKIEGDAAKMVEGEFTCDIAEWQPQVDYTVADGGGRLAVIQPEIRYKSRWGRILNDWNLRFENAIPLDLLVELNASSGELRLSPLTLHRLDLHLNASSLNLALQGEQSQLTEADFEFNAGHVNLHINGAFPRLKFFDFEINASKALVDLTGEWQHSQDIMLEVNAGWMTVKLPNNVGVQVSLESSLAMARHEGLKPGHGALVNEAFGTSPVTLRLDVVANVGKVDLQVVHKIAVV